ncbi:MAG: lipoprotein-releasing system ATP-binding protein LolD 1 [Pirellulaceae bacterium]|nr:MAG: lipoprotein-releasing system ATP-binding protein LolD 1 [Pirellulaceae bacterium]
MADLQVSKLCKQFVTAAETLRVLDGIDLQLAGGEDLSIVGPSGCGKSTLLYILGTLDRPTSGTVLLDGIDPFQLSPDQLAAFRNKNIGFVFQDHHLLPQLTVLENVLIPAVANGTPSEETVAMARELVEAVGLTSRIDHLPGQLSGGERQRVAVARAMLFRPKLLLADEPTGNLDFENTQRIAELLFQLPKRFSTMLIVVTHSQWVAERATRRARLLAGKLQEVS